MPPKILIVDDEKDIVDLLKYNLQKEGFETVEAFNGEEALEKLRRHKPNLILLDVMMPKLDGWEVAKIIRANSNYNSTALIFLTAKSSELDQVLGLRVGSDDYLVKPVSIPILIARIKLRLKDKTINKHLSQSSDSILKYKNIELDKIKHKVIVDKEEVFFPNKEFELLAMLLKNKGNVLKREIILDLIWGTNVFVISRTIDVHIRKIREKLGKNGKYIETIKSIGYRLNDE